MTRTATHKLTRIAAVLAPAATLAATCAHVGWSDEKLKHQITRLDNSTSRIRSL
jgi:hypothetical protein